MHQKYSVFLKITFFVMIILLTACSRTPEPSGKPEASNPVNEGITAPEAGESPEASRPETENFELMTADGNQSYKAALHQGEGFSLYVFEKFTFDAAEGCLFLTSHPEYDVKIEPLPENYDPTQLEATGREEVETFGEVFDYSGELVEHPLGFAEVYLQASSAEGIKDYIVWQSEAGDAFLFRLHNPKGEEATDFAGPVFVSLSTVQSDN